MKKLLLILLCVPLLFSCGEKEEKNNTDVIDDIINEEEIQMKEGIAYYNNKLFSGEGYRNYENGELQLKRNYLNGEKHGIARYWLKDNGQLFSEEEFNKGLNHGMSKMWYPSGQLLTEVYSEYGKIISVRCWDEEGNKIDCERITK